MYTDSVDAESEREELVSYGSYTTKGIEILPVTMKIPENILKKKHRVKPMTAAEQLKIIDSRAKKRKEEKQEELDKLKRKAKDKTENIKKEYNHKAEKNLIRRGQKDSSQ